MSDLLPSMSVAIRGAPEQFLRQMAELAEASGEFAVERNLGEEGRAGMECVNFRWSGVSPHRGLGFQLISRPDISVRILLEVRAERWTPDPPTAPIYREAAKSLVSPLLKAYNRANGTHCRLRIERVERARFKLTARTATLLDRFALLANKNSLHPLDWNRFYRIVSEARQEIPEHEVRALLSEAGFSPAASARLAELYTHLWAFKRLR